MATAEGPPGTAGSPGSWRGAWGGSLIAASPAHSLSLDFGWNGRDGLCGRPRQARDTHMAGPAGRRRFRGQGSPAGALSRRVRGRDAAWRRLRTDFTLQSWQSAPSRRARRHHTPGPSARHSQGPRGVHAFSAVSKEQGGRLVLKGINVCPVRPVGLQHLGPPGTDGAPPHVRTPRLLAAGTVPPPRLTTPDSLRRRGWRGDRLRLPPRRGPLQERTVGHEQLPHRGP